MRHDDGSWAKPLVESDDGLTYVGLSDDHAVVDSGERGDVFGDWLVWVNQLLVSVYEFSVMDFHGSDFNEFGPVFGFETGGFGIQDHVIVEWCFHWVDSSGVSTLVFVPAHGVVSSGK